MRTKQAGMVAGLAAAGLALTGVVALNTPAFAGPTEEPSAAPTTTATPRAWGAGEGRGRHQHTAVAGDEAQKVIDAVKARFPDANVTTVEKDPDGSYDARGSKADNTPIMYEVSADLQTITECPGDGPGGRGGPGEGRMGRGGPGVVHTAVTGDEAQKVIDAVKAKDADATIAIVFKDARGSYHAIGAKGDGTRIKYNVSSDLQTITEAGGGMGRGPRR